MWTTASTSTAGSLAVAARPLVTVQRHEVLDWLGPVDLYADRAQRVEIADAILASGSDDEGEWLEIMGRTVAERPTLDREVMSEAGIDTARISPRRSSTSMRRASCCSSSSTRSAPRRYAAAASAGSP